MSRHSKAVLVATGDPLPPLSAMPLHWRHVQLAAAKERDTGEVEVVPPWNTQCALAVEGLGHIDGNGKKMCGFFFVVVDNLALWSFFGFPNGQPLHMVMVPLLFLLK
jgi:hypothetical protein